VRVTRHRQILAISGCRPQQRDDLAGLGTPAGSRHDGYD